MDLEDVGDESAGVSVEPEGLECSEGQGGAGLPRRSACARETYVLSFPCCGA